MNTFRQTDRLTEKQTEIEKGMKTTTHKFRSPSLQRQKNGRMAHNKATPFLKTNKQKIEQVSQ